MTDGPILETQIVAPPPWEAPVERRFTVGSVIARTLSVWWKHVLAFTALSAVVYSPFAGAFGLFYGSLLGTTGPRPEQLATYGIAVTAAMVVTVVLAVIQAGAVTYGTVRHLSGERVRVGAMLGAGLRRGLPVVGVGFVLWLGVVVGSILLLVPGVFLLVAGCVAVPAAVVERPGVLGAIRRSFALTRGRRWALLGAGITVLILVSILSAAAQVGAMALLSVLLPPLQAARWLIFASQLGNVLFSALPLIGIAVAYHELRVEKEGVDTAALARVFE